MTNYFQFLSFWPSFIYCTRVDYFIEVFQDWAKFPLFWKSKYGHSCLGSITAAMCKSISAGFIFTDDLLKCLSLLICCRERTDWKSKRLKANTYTKKVLLVQNIWGNWYRRFSDCSRECHWTHSESRQNNVSP